MPRIAVGVRFRPDDAGGIGSSNGPLRVAKYTIGTDGKSLEWWVGHDGTSTSSSTSAIGPTKHTFVFDHLFHGDATQEEIFHAVCLGERTINTSGVPNSPGGIMNSETSLIGAVLEGYNACIFAYGQTGAGKTHTMSGSDQGMDLFIESAPQSLGKQVGMTARMAVELFQRAALNPDSSFSFRVSVLEVYNETLHDLLANPHPAANSIIAGTSSFLNVGSGGSNTSTESHRLSVIETTGGVVVPGLHIIPVDNAESAIQVLTEALANRAVAEHQLNRRSSRSHVLYTFYVTRTTLSRRSHGSTTNNDPIIHQSKVNLVDLAGSERVSKTGSTGSVQREANYINKSLSFLEQVVVALGQSGRDHIPYRQSKLTHLLKDSLGGNCHTYMVACVWPHSNHAWETLSTLRFAARMKMIETHPVRNRLGGKEAPPNRVLQQQVMLLRRELAARDLIFLTSPRPSYTIGNTGGGETDDSSVGGNSTGTAAVSTAPWLPEMTEGQTAATYQRLLRFCSDADGSTDPGAPLAEQAAAEMETLDLHSLTQAYAMMSVLRSALWTACGNDSSSVTTALQNAITMRSSLPPQRLARLFPIAEESVAEGDAVAADSAVMNPEQEEPPVEQEIDPAAREELFRIFTEGDGKPLFATYEGLKETLKINKQRQREIVALLNEQKSIIDSAKEQLSVLNGEHDEDSEHPSPVPTSADGDATTANEETIQVVKERLETAKRSYRMAHHELQIAKDQITETQSLRSRAMATLMSAFNDHLSTTNHHRKS